MDMSDLTILCNGCGEAMRKFGEWPVVFPVPEESETKGSRNVRQAYAYACKTCKIPAPMYDKGIPVRVSILKE